MPEWSFHLLLGGTILLSLTAGGWGLRRIQGPPQHGQVKGSPYAAGGAVLGVVAAVGFTLVGIFLSDLSAPGQLLPWMLLVGSFAGAAFILLYFCTGLLARYDADSVTLRDWRRQWRRARWHEVREVKVDVWSNVVFQLRTGRNFSLPADAGGLFQMIEAAELANVPGASKLLGRESA